jgi:DNA-binding NtrC family response regulator
MLDVGVLLTAERGIDVDSIARELHGRSRRGPAPYVVVDCDVDRSRLVELLFGTGPEAGTRDLEPVSGDSRIAAARGGTLFLQEVTELPAAAQVRLARLARDGEASIDGQSVAINIRFVACASPAIDTDVHAQRFRSDLFRRLAGVRIDLPSLRDRQEDVPALAARVLDDACATHGLAPRSFTQAAQALLAAVTWPGNVAQLQAAVDRIVNELDRHYSGDLTVEHLLPVLNLERSPARFVPSGNLREARLRFERDYISAVLQHHGWRMADAAQTLGIQRPNLYRKARQLGIPVTRLPE